MKFPKKNSAINTSLLNNQSILNKLPDSYIAEIQQIKIDLKQYDGENVLQQYLSGLLKASGIIYKKLSIEDQDLFAKILNSQPYLGHNPYESSISVILKKQEYIEKAWKVVHAGKNDLRLRMEGIKKILMPITEAKTYEESVEVMRKISSERNFDNITANFDTITANLLNEMHRYKEKDLIIEFVPFLQKVITIVENTRKIAIKRWMDNNLISGKKNNSWSMKLEMYDSIRHMTSGLNDNTVDAIKMIKIEYPNILNN